MVPRGGGVGVLHPARRPVPWEEFFPSPVDSAGDHLLKRSTTAPVLRNLAPEFPPLTGTGC